MDNSQLNLPSYSDSDLAKLSPADLTDILIDNLDRVPLNVIDACARHGAAMTEHLRQLHEDDFLWLGYEAEPEEIVDGIWWLRFHTVTILGLIPSEQAGLLLVDLMRRMSLEDDDNLQDWLSGYWPALFLNKPDTLLPALRALSEDKNMDWYIRANAVEPVLKIAAKQGADTLDQTLVWLAGIVADEQEDWVFRLLAGNTLLDYPRTEYRAMLESLADRHDIHQAYSDKSNRSDRFANPWKFYAPEAITERQKRWIKEAEREAQRYDEGETDYPYIPNDPFDDHEPYIRPEPKIGRNDPCPCGSGKKYKKCCLPKVSVEFMSE